MVLNHLGFRLPVNPACRKDQRTMPCKIDHTAPDMLPVSLCATCNPRGPADLKAIEAQERGEREAARAIERRRYELQKANYRVRAMVRHGEPEPGTVNHTVLGALRKKINRLEQSAT